MASNSHPSNASLKRQREVRLRATLALIAAIWFASDLGYYWGLPAVGLGLGYNASPVPIALYYAFWIAITIITFWPVYRGWQPFEKKWSAYVLLSLSLSGSIVFVVYLLPLLPPINWPEAWGPPELALATPWYFLPKAIDILFQQLLLVVMVLAFAAERCSLRTMSVCCGCLFGATHLLLAFGGVPLGYVIRFAVVATLFGFAFPYLILRVRNGFAYSYLSHWGYYAVTVAMVHTISPYAP